MTDPTLEPGTVTKVRKASEVSTDDVFDMLQRIGCPTVFYTPDGREPGPEDMAQLIGALTAAVDRLALAHRVPLDSAGRRAWAAGYLQAAGARTPCGARTAFDLLAVRLQMFETLFEGLSTPGDTAELLRACLGAATGYAVANATGNAITAGLYPPDEDPELTELMRRNVAEAHAQLSTAVHLDQRVRAALVADDDGR